MSTFGMECKNKRDLQLKVSLTNDRVAVAIRHVSKPAFKERLDSLSRHRNEQQSPNEIR